MIFALALATQLTTSDAFDRAAKIDAAIAIVRPVAYRTRKVDWARLKATMVAQTKHARDDVDMLPAWATLADGLKDGHSFVQPTSAAKVEWRRRYANRPMLAGAPPARKLNSRFVDRVGITRSNLSISHETNALVVTVPSVTGLGVEAKAYAKALFGSIAESGERTCGYVLDLRGNTGGNVWPMLLGLSGLLGDGPQGRTRDATGKIEPYANLTKGAVVVLAARGRGLTMMQLDTWKAVPRLTSAPVALLIDDATASSGEGVAIAFAGRRSTRMFGVRTYGAASSNEGFALSDGSNMVITTAMMIDRRERAYPNGIKPDTLVATNGDAPVQAAQAWLSRQPACSKLR